MSMSSRKMVNYPRNSKQYTNYNSPKAELERLFICQYIKLIHVTLTTNAYQPIHCTLKHPFNNLRDKYVYVEPKHGLCTFIVPPGIAVGDMQRKMPKLNNSSTNLNIM